MYEVDSRLADHEIERGFVRPVRELFTHLPTDERECGVTTRMGLSMAEMFARSPSFYLNIHCIGCKAEFPIEEFVWEGTEERVGS